MCAQATEASVRGPSITQPWEPHSCADWCYRSTHLPARTRGSSWGLGPRVGAPPVFPSRLGTEVLTSPRPTGCCWALVHYSAHPYTTHTQRHTHPAATQSQPQLTTWHVLPDTLAACLVRRTNSWRGQPTHSLSLLGFSTLQGRAQELRWTAGTLQPFFCLPAAGTAPMIPQGAGITSSSFHAFRIPSGA